MRSIYSFKANCCYEYTMCRIYLIRPILCLPVKGWLYLRTASRHFLWDKLFAAKKVFRFHSQANHFTADEPPVLQAAEKIRWCKFLFAGLLEGDVFVGDAARLRRKCRPTTQRPSSQSAPADRRRRRTVRGRHWLEVLDVFWKSGIFVTVHFLPKLRTILAFKLWPFWTLFGTFSLP